MASNLTPGTKRAAWVGLLIAGALYQGCAFAQNAPGVADLLSANAPSTETVEVITAVRKNTLMELARTLGSQRGLGDRSREIVSEMEAMAAELDRTYRFNELVFGSGFLPAVIDEERDVVSLGEHSFTHAQRRYVMKEAVKAVAVAPTWRNYLFVGLQPNLRPQMPTESEVLPRTDAERKFWDSEIRAAYEKGRAQAQSAFELNIARLERTYLGMRRYYEIYAREMIEPPVLDVADAAVVQPDAKTMLVGQSTVMVTRQPSFAAKADGWRPLGAD